MLSISAFDEQAIKERFQELGNGSGTFNLMVTTTAGTPDYKYTGCHIVHRNPDGELCERPGAIEDGGAPGTYFFELPVVDIGTGDTFDFYAFAMDASGAFVEATFSITVE